MQGSLLNDTLYTSEALLYCKVHYKILNYILQRHCLNAKFIIKCYLITAACPAVAETKVTRHRVKKNGKNIRNDLQLLEHIPSVAHPSITLSGALSDRIQLQLVYIYNKHNIINKYNIHSGVFYFHRSFGLFCIICMVNKM